MSRRLTPDRSEQAAQAGRAFVEAFNEGDLDRFVSLLDAEVMLHSMRGPVAGRERARDWATRPPGGVQQKIEIVATRVAPGAVLFEVDRVWHWAEDGTHASTDEMAWLFEVGDDGLITSWRPFEDRTEAATAMSERDPA